MQPIQGQGEVILYQTDDGQAKINLKAIDGSVWLTQLEIAELFAATKQNISLHIKNILKDGELVEASVVKESLTTAADGKNYKTKLFSLPMILAIGYRVRSPRGTLHVGWAVKPINRRLRWASLAFSPSYVGLREASR
ncbi:RhuM family protein [Methylomonas koyamae]|uniref:RhuM family protein n=1 Tax=Methylomonas koyamae TaxID=702114 RepID=UPI0011271ED5|nr:RhuM family protein [Methylomonas koyamae]TPQ27638.1 cell filamentation protein Fic [Methylomonas koyamae]